MKKISKEAKDKSQLTKEEWKEYTKTVWSIANIGHNEHPAVFPEELPLRLIKLFSFWGETVLDPFGGTGTTAKVAASLGRGAVSVDQNKGYVRIAKERCRSLSESPNSDASIEIVHGDSRKLDFLQTDSVSLIVTSPPYWDKADYGSGKNDIGSRDTYVAFLAKMREVLVECYRVLEPGRKICVNTANVNQFTDHGLLTFPIAADLCVIMRDLGFVMINELIWSKDKTGGKWGSANGQRPIFGSYPYPPNFLFKNVHEYILIFAKPGGEKRKGEKVRLYTELMGEAVPVKSVEIQSAKAESDSDEAPPSRRVRARRLTKVG